MGDCLERVNNCLQFLNLCKPKESTNNTKTASSNDSSTKLINMSKYFTLMLPTRPKLNDEIRIKAKLKHHPKEFVINLCVDSALNDEEEPAMIAFHFKTKFKHHHDGQSSVRLTYKRGPNGWDEVEDIENTWIDDNVEDIDISILFTKREIQFLSGGSAEYTFGHQFEMHRIDRLQIGGDFEYIEEVALRYNN